MKYILNPSIALRSWQLVPYAYYRRHERNASGLSREEFVLLSKCDGQHEQESSELHRKLIERGFIEVCNNPAATLSDWQQMSCDNRYMPAMNLMITGKCNYNCRHCFNAADNSPLMSEWTLGEIEKLLDEAQQCGINAFTLTGGEPMLHKGFFDILEGIYKRGMYVEELNTNGYFVTSEALSRMKALGCMPLMKISFDGVGFHDWMRGHAGAEKRALDAITLCKRHGFRVKVQTNVWRDNVSAMLPTARLMSELGVDEVRIIRTTEAPRWYENNGGQLLTWEEYFDFALDFIGEYKNENLPLDICIWQFITLFGNKTFSAAAVHSACGRKKELSVLCGGARGMIAVAADGELYPCHQMSGYYVAKGMSLGNVKKGLLKDYLRGGEYLDTVCLCVSDLTAANSKCRNCRHLDYCCGGCRAIGLMYTGDYLACDPTKCLFWENGYYEKVRKRLDGWRDLSPMSIVKS